MIPFSSHSMSFFKTFSEKGLKSGGGESNGNLRDRCWKIEREMLVSLLLDDKRGGQRVFFCRDFRFVIAMRNWSCPVGVFEAKKTKKAPLRKNLFQFIYDWKFIRFDSKMSTKNLVSISVNTGRKKYASFNFVIDCRRWLQIDSKNEPKNLFSKKHSENELINNWLFQSEFLLN